MKINLIVVGKTDDAYIQEGIAKYAKRMKHYSNFELITIPDIKKSKNLSENQRKDAEGKLILEKIASHDFIVLLDEKGKEYDSVGFAGFIEKKMLSGIKNLTFIIGGAYGFAPAVYQAIRNSGNKIALSQMTFSHQLVRLVFMEQLYRAMTIIRGEPYHHM